MTWWEVLYLAAVAIIITVEHRLFSKAWKRQERARITMGVATVTGLAFPLTLTGTLDFHTWLILFFAFGIAGALTTGLYIAEKEMADSERARSLRSVLHDRAAEADSEQRP